MIMIMILIIIAVIVTYTALGSPLHRSPAKPSVSWP